MLPEGYEPEDWNYVPTDLYKIQQDDPVLETFRARFMDEMMPRQVQPQIYIPFYRTLVADI
jgi:hypothetical protein